VIRFLLNFQYFLINNILNRLNFLTYFILFSASNDRLINKKFQLTLHTLFPILLDILFYLCWSFSNRILSIFWFFLRSLKKENVKYLELVEKPNAQKCLSYLFIEFLNFLFDISQWAWVCSHFLQNIWVKINLKDFKILI
jgi:hypothetical protein